MNVNKFNSNIINQTFMSNIKPAKSGPDFCAKEINDSFESKNQSPPQISNLQILSSIITKEQVAQINQTRKLPDNLCFKLVPGNRFVSDYRHYPHWRIVIKTQLNAGGKSEKQTNVLPDGYIVKNDLVRGLEVVKE